MWHPAVAPAWRPGAGHVPRVIRLVARDAATYPCRAPERTRMNHRLTLPAALLLLAVVATALLGLSLAIGSFRLTPLEILDALGSGTPTLARDIVLELRLPRAMSAMAVGGMLALSGALLQVLLRNPLADPYVLGISGGASVFALVAIMVGLPVAGVGGAAALGAFATCAAGFRAGAGPGRMDGDQAAAHRHRGRGRHRVGRQPAAGDQRRCATCVAWSSGCSATCRVRKAGRGCWRCSASRRSAARRWAAT